jgi:magnesium chelatase family protein
MRTTAAFAWSVALYGLDGTPVTITAQLGPTPPRATPAPESQRVGREVRERVRAAVRNSGLSWPTEHVSVTTSSPLPGGTSLADLAVACAVLAADGQLPAHEVARTVLVGELGLDGHLRPVRGILPAVLAARHAGLDRAIVPTSTLPEATLLPGIRVLGADRLADVAASLRGAQGHLTSPALHAPDLGPMSGAAVGADVAPAMPDAPDLAGRPEAVRAVEVAAAGGHHLLLIGRPGTGKLMFATRLPGLLPPLTREQALEVTAVHSMAGRLAPETPLVTTPPFIAPHHSTSIPALVGGGAGLAKPGAISQAHHGVLFLDLTDRPFRCS